MFFKSALDDGVEVVGKVLLFVQLGYPQVSVHFFVVENLVVLLLVGRSVID